MPDIEKNINQVLEGYKAAVFAKDVGAFIKLYDAKVRVFDTWGVWSYEGAESWQLMIEDWFQSLDTERVKVTFEDISTVSGGGVATVSAFVTYAALSAEGEQLRAMQNRLTWVLKSNGDELKIVHEHTSAPVGFEDMKAILARGKNG